MKLLGKIVFGLVVGLLAGTSGFAQSGDAGNSGLAFLKLGVGGRAAGMSEAYVAVADEATATYWNPAGLAFLKRSQLAFTHTEWLQDISNDFLAFTFPAFRGALGLSVYSNNVGGIERRVRPSDTPLGTVEAHDLAVGLSYGRAFGDKLTGGLTVKYLYEKIFVESANGFALDLGFTFTPFDNGLRLALVAQNFGSMGSLLDESIDLPNTLRVGLAYHIPMQSMGGGILLAADAVKVFETELRGNFGVEFQVKNILAFRTGYQTGLEDKGIAGGFGVNFNRYHLNYGFTPFTNLGDTHRFSIGLDL